MVEFGSPDKRSGGMLNSALVWHLCWKIFLIQFQSPNFRGLNKCRNSISLTRLGILKFVSEHVEWQIRESEMFWLLSIEIDRWIWQWSLKSWSSRPSLCECFNVRKNIRYLRLCLYWLESKWFQQMKHNHMICSILYFCS